MTSTIIQPDWLKRNKDGSPWYARVFRITTIRIGGDEGRVAIRIGSHFGPVVAEDRDIFGAAVAVANRMTSQAKAGQVLTTSALVGQLSPQWRALVRQIDVATPKGQSDEVAVFEVLWQPEEATSMLPSVDPGARRQAAPVHWLRCSSKAKTQADRRRSLKVKHRRRRQGSPAPR